MRRRFGRRRKRGSEDRSAPIDARWLERIVEAGLAPVGSLDVHADDGVPDTLAVLGVGAEDGGERCLVAFAPRGGGAAVLAALVAASRLADQDGFTGRALAIAPEWREGDRRLLGSVGALPFRLEAVAAPALRDEGATVSAGGQAPAPLTTPEQVGASLPDASSRALFARAVATLGGLAAKHQGALRGVGSSVELVLMARRVAVLRPEGTRVVLETLEPTRERAELGEDTLAEALDRLEGAVRKRLNDRRVREGEEGRRSGLRGSLAAAASLRDLQSWPLPGADPEVLDLVAVDGDDRLVVAAVREQFDLVALCDVLEAAGRLEGALPSLSAAMAPPIRSEAPRLLLAGDEFGEGVSLALSRLTLDCACFDVRGTALSARATSRAAAPARSRRAAPRPERPAPAPAADKPAPRETAEAAPKEGEAAATDVEAAEVAPRSGRRRRRRGGRGGSASGDDKPEARASAEESESGSEGAGAEAEGAPGYLELSLFDLDDEATREDEEGGRARGRRRRGRGRRGRRPSGGDENGAEAGATTGADAEAPGASETDTDDVVDDEDLTGLSPDAPDEDEAAVAAYDEADLAETPLTAADQLRLERDRRRLARVVNASAAEEGELPVAREEEDAEVALPRGRVAILALADRDAVASAVLLARELRNVEGIWVYPQEELMTFFRSVATDLRNNTPIYVLGFTATPSHDVLQAAALYRDRLVWFDHHAWPPEDLHALRESVGSGLVHVFENVGSTLPLVLAACGRRSRFSDKLVDLMTGRFTRHDYERWGRVWWSRVGEIAGRTGDQASALEPLISGRPSDLAAEAADVPMPPPPEEAAFAASRDFRLVHFGGYGMAVLDVPRELDVHLAARIVRERYDVELSFARTVEEEVLFLGAEETTGRRAMDLGGMVDHLGSKFEWATSLPDADHVARLRVEGLAAHPDRLDEVVAELAMGRSILEG